MWQIPICESRMRRWESATWLAMRLSKTRGWASSRQKAEDRLLGEFEVNRLAQDVEEQFLAFLNAGGGGARHYQVKRGHALGEAAVSSEEANALHLLFVGLFQCAQHVARLAAGGKCDQQVAPLT